MRLITSCNGNEALRIRCNFLQQESIELSFFFLSTSLTKNTHTRICLNMPALQLREKIALCGKWNASSCHLQIFCETQKYANHRQPDARRYRGWGNGLNTAGHGRQTASQRRVFAGSIRWTKLTSGKKTTGSSRHISFAGAKHIAHSGFAALAGSDPDLWKSEAGCRQHSSIPMPRLALPRVGSFYSIFALFPIRLEACHPLVNWVNDVKECCFSFQNRIILVFPFYPLIRNAHSVNIRARISMVESKPPAYKHTHTGHHRWIVS